MGAEVVEDEELAFNMEHGEGEIVFFDLETLVFGTSDFLHKVRVATSDITASTKLIMDDKICGGDSGNSRTFHPLFYR